MSGQTIVEYHQQIVSLYQQAGEPWPAEAKEIAVWAIGQKLYHPRPETVVAQAAEDFARAMREEIITDPQGRPVRAKHVARVRGRNGRQLSIWGDIRTADRRHMEMAFQQRRQQIVGDCRQLKRDADSFNENRNREQPIQLIFDFTDDLAELEAMDEACA